nr:ArsC family transcriptional regulator [Clostridia bacterium]
MAIQIYTFKKNFDTQKAERYFKERRIPYQLVDLTRTKMG